MSIRAFALVLLAAVCIQAFPLPEGWHIESPVAPDDMTILRIRLSLVQRNLDELYRRFLEVSDPDHPNYAQYMTAEEIRNLVRPGFVIESDVADWLSAQKGITAFEMMADYVNVWVEANAVQTLFQTKLVWAVNSRGSRRAHASTELILPAAIAGFVEHVEGLRAPPKPLKLKRFSAAAGKDDVIIPTTIRNLYTIHSNPISTNVSQSVSEYSDDHSFMQSDLKAYATGVGEAPPRPFEIKGPYQPQDPDAESTLDVQMISGVGVNASNVFWTLRNWILEFVQDLSNDPNPPLVNSVSWGADERQEGYSYNNRVDVEFQKLALRGVTMIAASGDSGAVGTGQCSGNSHTLNPGYPAASPFILSVGATMLSEGTTLTTNLPPLCKSRSIGDCAETGTEVPADVPSEQFASGGGFSVFSPRPSYQDAVVNAYLTNKLIKKPPKTAFNATNRGFPDVSAIGNNIAIYLGGQWGTVGGTSASAPCWGGIISILNDVQLLAKRKPLGFVNPLLYKAFSAEPGSFTSVGTLHTNNKDGCPEGYISNPHGWDPVTGLGTPNVLKLISYLEANNIGA